MTIVPIERFRNWLAGVQAWYINLRSILRMDKKGWLICACVLVVTVVRSGITYSFGVFVVELKNTYKTSMAEQDWIGTLSFCISLSCAPISVAFIRTLKYRGYRIGGLLGSGILTISCLGSSFVKGEDWMFFTHSFLYGVGSSLLYMASSLVIGEYFDKSHRYHVLATSILLCGYPIGSLLFNPINAWLVTRFGWRVGFRVASGMIALTGACCCWSFSSKDSPGMTRLAEEAMEVDHVTPADEDATPVDKHAEAKENFAELKARPRYFCCYIVGKYCCTLDEVRARPEIVLWYMANCLSYLGFYMPFINLAFYMNLKGITPVRSSWALTLLSAAECVTYIFASFFGDYLKGKLVSVNVVAAGFLSLICFIWPSVDITYGVILLVAIVMGGFLGLTIVYTYAASGEVTELPIDKAWSFTNLWSGIGILIGPFFSGFVYDFRKSYDDVFYVVGAIYLVDAFLFGAIFYLLQKRQQQFRPDYNEISGIVGDKQTFKITTKRSISKSSLVNEEDAVAEYGTTATTEHAQTPKTPPPFEANFNNGAAVNYEHYGYNQSGDRNHTMAANAWQKYDQ